MENHKSHISKKKKEMKKMSNVAIKRKRPSALSLPKLGRPTCGNQCKMNLKGRTPKKTWRCGYQAFDIIAETQYRLWQHKEQEGHKKEVGQPQSSV